MDYANSIESLIPGVQGRVLAVLTRSETELTMRGVAELAGVSPQQASVVLARLVGLGLVERRDVPPVSLVRLSRQNLAAQHVASLAQLRETALARLADLAQGIQPRPASLIVFGSFARGDADAESDVGVLAVRPKGLASREDRWAKTLGAWRDDAARLLGNPVNLIEAATDEVPTLLERPGPSVWRAIATEGIVLAGANLPDISAVA